MSYLNNLYIPRHTSRHDLWEFCFNEMVAAIDLQAELNYLSEEYKELREYSYIMYGAAKMITDHGKEEFFRRSLTAYKNFVV